MVRVMPYACSRWEVEFVDQEKLAIVADAVVGRR